jgi:hypothetical protein
MGILEWRCICGSTWVTMTSPPSLAEKLKQFWWAQHSGPGHGPVAMTDQCRNAEPKDR